MPTILRIGGYEFLIYLKDHEPPHVHVFAHGCEAIINLSCSGGSPQGRRNFRFKQQEFNEVIRVTSENQDYLCSKWKDLHANA